MAEVLFTAYEEYWRQSFFLCFCVVFFMQIAYYYYFICFIETSRHLLDLAL